MMNSGEKNPWDNSNDNESPAQSPLSRSKKSGGLHDASPEEEEQSPEFIAYLTSPQRAFHLERQTQTLDERRQLKVQRNQEALHRLFIHYDSNGIPLDASKERVGVSNTASFPTRQSFHPQVDTVLPKKPQAPLKDQLEKLQEKFPFRSNQIQLLFHLLHSITWQQQIQQQKEDLFIPPPPIFCFGSGGTGKTAVVKEVVKLLATFSDLVTIIPAYVDCGLLGNESYATSTLDSSAGTNKSQVLQSAWKDILYEVFYSVLETQSSEQANTITDNLDAAIVVVEEEESEGEIQDEESIYNDENRIEDERKGLRRKETTDTNSITCKSKKVLPDKTMQSGIQVCSSDGPIHNEAIGRSSADKMYKGRSAALQRGPMKGNGLPPLLQLPLLTSNLSKYTTGLPGVFAKSLDHICGPSSGRKNHVVLVLDRAECLLGLMSWFSQSERNSMLSQILFLPQHYKLNLCVIVISSHGLLQYTRIHNTQEPTEFIGTLSEMINPIRVYFENYKGPDMFETVSMACFNPYFCLPHLTFRI
jgi:Cdc6-like AAA superfamily ATPase